MDTEARIVPCLWFDTGCEEAIDYYIATFAEAPHRRGDSRVVSIARYEADSNVPGAAELAGKVLTAIFELDGHRFMALDGGPIFKFTPAVSFTVDCIDQADVDHFWERLSAVPEAEQCGWCTDRWGVSWQIVPRLLGELLSSPDRVKAKAAMDAMLEMKKLDVAELQRAYDAG
jgi:predicted 3-demethylubiquinone-9 3-methyltransferase (glyoxalase superfamily)